MKRILFILVLLSTPLFQLYSQNHFTAYPIPSTGRQISAFSQEIVCVAAYNGILRSSNQGQSWDTVYGTSGAIIIDILTIDNVTGFVVGSIFGSEGLASLLLKTTNAGLTWERITLPGVRNLYNINYYHDRICITGDAGYEGSKLIVSTDRGNNWMVFDCGTDIWFSGMDDLLVTDSASYSTCFNIKKTEDNIHWNYIYLGSRQFQGTAKSGGRLLAVGASRVGTSGDFPLLSYSDDQGISWHDTIMATQGFLYRIKLLNDNIGFACGEMFVSGVYYSVVYKTTNRGLSWTEIGNLPFGPLHDLSIIGNKVYFVAYDYVIRMDSDSPLPVELSSFTSTVRGNEVTLNWSTASEINNSAFSVERKKNGEDWSTVGSVIGHGTISGPQSYTYIDRNILSGRYNYRLKQIDFNGNYEYFNLNSEVVVEIPGKFQLEQNFPNPFNPTTKIRFSMPEAGITKLTLFDIAGKEVATLLKEEKQAGAYEVEFNAGNITSGTYFYKLEVGTYTETKKMILIK